MALENENWNNNRTFTPPSPPNFQCGLVKIDTGHNKLDVPHTSTHGVKKKVAQFVEARGGVLPQILPQIDNGRC